MSSWHKFTGRYIKTMYQVRLACGDIILCWPNAGMLHAMDGSGRQFTDKDDIEIKVSKDWNP